MGDIYLLNLGLSFGDVALQTGAFTPPPASVPNYFSTSQLWLKHKPTSPTPTWAAVPGVNSVNVPFVELNWDTPTLSRSGPLFTI